MRSVGIALLLAVAALPAVGQEGGLDARALRVVYEIEAPAFVGAMRAADASAYPVFVAAAPGLWAASLAEPDLRDDAARLTFAEAGAAVTAMGLKRILRRERPYRRDPTIVPRTHGYAARMDDRDPLSLPSGHATISSAMATAAVLSAPRWYVAAPAGVWALSVATSRVWHGVHYPSDVLAGMALGVAIGFAADIAADALFDDDRTAPAMSIRIRL